MDSRLMVKYVNYLNEIRTKNSTQEDLVMLVYDSFKDHLEKSVKEKFHENGIDLIVISGDLTSICQPLDIMINKLFKDNFHKE